MCETIVPRQSRRLLTVFSMAVVGLILGCGGGGELPEGETGTVSGKVTFEGKAVPEGAAIIFVHKEKGLTASGSVKSGGSYSLRMRGGGDILTGSYQIGVSPPTSELTPEQEEAITLGKAEYTEKTWPEIPEKYRTAEDSGITFEVKAGGNTFDLDMKEGPAGD